MRNQKKFNLNNIKHNTDRNKQELQEKKSDVIIVKPTNDTISRATLIHEVDWSLCELEKIPEALTTTIETLLPEKALYSYSFNLDIPEKYLQYLNFDVLAKTLPEQNITCVQEFNFTSLREIAIDIYRWWGTLYTLGLYHDWNKRVTPPPPFLYKHIEYIAQENPRLWYIENSFIPDHNWFGAPEGKLPPGGLTDYSTDKDPNQFWTGRGQQTFQGFYEHYGDYDDAVDGINAYYDDILYTPKDSGPPYHSYIHAVNNQVCVADKQVIINKLATDKFNIQIKGNYLLLSKAVRPTSWSDSDFPTYEPTGGDMYTSLRVYLDPTLNTITYENYTF